MRWLSKAFPFLSILMDSLAISIALAFSAWVRPAINSLPFAQDVIIQTVPGGLYIFFPVIWVGILLLLAAYDEERYPKLGDRLLILIIGAGLATLSMAGTLYLSFREVSRLLFLSFVLLALMLQISWRGFAWIVKFPLHKAALRTRRVIVVGPCDSVQAFYQQIKGKKGLDVHFIGILSNTQPEQSEIPFLGGLDDVAQVIQRYHIDDVILIQAFSLQEQATALITLLHSFSIQIWLVPDYMNMTIQKADMAEFAGTPMLDLHPPVLTTYQRSLKRAFDLAITLLILPFFLPVMALIALVLRVQEHGPVIFRQVRVGENGRLFEMYKFRSMVINADSLSHLVKDQDSDGNIMHKAPDDPRITRMGHFLRRTSMDELPQLFNILRGEMSLVGPRPELPHLVEKYQPWQWRRFSVPQGLTGWWQINGRSDRPMHLNTEDDLFYIRNYSLTLDLWILIRTFGAVIQGKGAF